MKNLIINGDPGIRKGGIIEVGGEEYVCFSVKRQGDWHGPEEVQLWCTVGSDNERGRYERRDYIPMHLETERVDASAVTVHERAGDLAV